jgi:hypothetical protein
MTTKSRHLLAAGLLGLLTVSACTDRPSPTLIEPPEGDDPTGPGGTPTHLVAITCRAEVREGTVECDPAVPTIAGVSSDIIVGGQNVFMRLVMSSGSYDAVSQQFNVSVRVRNLIPQALGTIDGITPAASGVRVFLQSGPTVSAGSGLVNAIADGSTTFMGGVQPYWQYTQVIQPFAESSNKVWSFSVPPTVIGFVFTAYVSAPVQFPDGWVDFDITSMTIRPTEQWRPNATVRTAYGTRIPDAPVVWSTSDTTLATVTGDGVVEAVRAGAVQITATSGTRTGVLPFQVLGMKRIWTGAVSTDWHTGGNWIPVGVVPVVADTAVIPASQPQYPLLTANASIGGLTVENSATVSLGAFDLTAFQDVATGTSGGVDGTVGRVILAGTAKSVHGVLPRVRVTGTYSLTGNLTLRAPLRVESGRLRNASFRVRATSF